MATSRLHVKALNLHQNIFCFDRSQNIHDYSKTFMIRKDFEMRRQFIDVFNELITAGLTSKWLKDLQNHQKLSEESANFRSISMTDFYAIFLPVFILLGGSVVVMLFEHFVHHKVHSANSHQYWIWLDKVICGQNLNYKMISRFSVVIHAQLFLFK